MIAVLDYGVGTPANVARALPGSIVTNDVRVAREADALILPGVGNFNHAMLRLRASFLDTVLLTTNVPVLGICVGMQMLYEGSEEARQGELGLGLIKGWVKKLPKPHVGWDYVDGVGHMYFVHHYGETWMVRQGNLTGVQFHPEKSGKAGWRFLREWAMAAVPV